MQNLDYIYRVVDQFSRPFKNINKSLKLATAATATMDKKVASLNMRMDTLKNSSDQARSRLLEMAAVAYVFAQPVRKAIEFEAAMTDVAKVVTFDVPNGLKIMSANIIEMSKKIPLTAEGLAEIVAAGGQFGIPAKKLEAFALQAAQMAIAFDILPEEAGQSMAKLAGAFQIPIEQMTRVGDAINHIAENVATSAPDIVTALRQGAAAGGQALRLTEEQTIALASAFMAQGISASEAGTRVSILARNLLNTAKTSKILGRSFTNLVKSNPQQAIHELFKRMNEGKISHEKFTKLLGLTVNDFKLLAKNSKEYEKILSLVSDKQKFAGSMQKEYNKKLESTKMKLKLLKNAFDALLIQLGDSFLPVLRAAVSILGLFLIPLNSLATQFPLLTSFVTGVIGSLIALNIIVIALRFSKLQLGLAFLTVQKIMLATTIGTKAYTLATTLLSVALRAAGVALRFMMGPIGWIIIGIQLLATGFVILYNKVEPFRSMVDTIVEAAKKTKVLGFVATTIGNMFSIVAAPVLFLIEAMKTLVSIGGSLFSKLKSILGIGGDVAGMDLDKSIDLNMNNNIAKQSADNMAKHLALQNANNVTSKQEMTGNFKASGEVDINVNQGDRTETSTVPLKMGYTGTQMVGAN